MPRRSARPPRPFPPRGRTRPPSAMQCSAIQYNAMQCKSRCVDKDAKLALRRPRSASVATVKQSSRRRRAGMDTPVIDRGVATSPTSTRAGGPWAFPEQEQERSTSAAPPTDRLCVNKLRRVLFKALFAVFSLSLGAEAARGAATRSRWNAHRLDSQGGGDLRCCGPCS